MAKVGQVKLPSGYYPEWSGQFRNLQAALRRLSFVAPSYFAIIFGLLYMALSARGRAAAVFLAVPLGLAGGVFTLALTGIAVSVSAAAGFICLAGVVVLNGLIVMTAIRERLEAGLARTEAIREGVAEKDAGGDHDGFRPRDRLRADGTRHRHRRRGPEAARHHRHRRPIVATILKLAEFLVIAKVVLA